MNRREFLKSAALMTAAGAVLGKDSILKAVETPAVKPERPILNFKPEMQYRPMGRTGVNVSASASGSCGCRCLRMARPWTSTRASP